MLTLGLKVGPTDWQEKFDQLGEKPAFVEIYFWIDQIEKYTALLNYLKKEKIQAGWHLWGLIENKYFPSIVLPNSHYRQKSLNFIRSFIDLARQNQAIYALFHVGQSCLSTFDFASKRYKIIDQSADQKSCQRIVKNSMKELIQFAQKNQTTPVVEIECQYQYDYWDRDKILVGKNQSSHGHDICPEIFYQISQLGRHICLDIAHLSTWCYQQNQSNSRCDLFNRFVVHQKAMLKGLKVVHAASILPPYQCDSGSGFMSDEIKADVFPNISELTKILVIFHKAPQEIMIVGEPRAEDHIETYWLLKEIIKNF